jgi:dCTP deaminase
LSEEFVVPDANARLPFIDLGEQVTFTRPVIRVTPEEGFVLHPGEFVLGVTAESVNLPDRIVGRIEGKSSLGRLGLMVHVTSGFIDPGFHGCLTLQMTNVLRVPIILRPGKRICQVVFAYMHSPAEHPYAGRYNADTVVASKGVE